MDTNDNQINIYIMNLIQSTITFLDQVNMFYEGNDRGNIEKLTIIIQAREEIEAIKACNDCEHPFRIIQIRRLLANTLPHHGYEHRIELEITLNKLLESCRRYLLTQPN